MPRKPFTLDDLHRRLMEDAEYAKEAQQTQPFAEVAMQLIQARCEAGLSQAAMAKRLGTTQSVISRIEQFDYTGLKLETLRRFAEVLGLELQVRLVKPEKVAS
jgi:ribosome-binding protein aMBF1 (putative translation factor)